MADAVSCFMRKMLFVGVCQLFPEGLFSHGEKHNLVSNIFIVYLELVNKPVSLIIYGCVVFINT